MNKIYRMIWSKVKDAWVIVSEVVKGNGGPAPVTVRTLLVAALLASGTAALALPTGPDIIHGNVGISTAGNAMTITNSAGAIINWQGFSIGNGELTRFVQPNAASSVLNRVVGVDPSAILGTLQSNGKVMLINPNGILFGPNSRVDVNGLIASTLNITNEDFLAGKMKFTAGLNAGKIVNQGSLNAASGGEIYLIAQDVENSGVITAPNGDVLLAAGKEVLLVDKNNPEIAVVLAAPEGGEAINLGSVAADAGRIGIYGSIVRQKGIVSANSAVAEGGRIFLRATKRTELGEGSVTSADGTTGGTVIAMTSEEGKISGTLTARGSITAKGDGSKGSGGFVETSAAKVDLNGVSVNTNGGEWLIDPDDFVIAASGGNMTGTQISQDLENNSVTIKPNPVGGGNGDILVNDAVSWSNNNTLKLDADRNIELNANITGSNGGLELIATDGKVKQLDGVIEVKNLSATAKNGIDLAKDNKVQTVTGLTNSASGNVTFINTVPLVISGPVSTQASSDAAYDGIRLQNSGNITLDGDITLTNLDASAPKVLIVSSTGAVTQNAANKIEAATLEVQSSSGISLLGNNQVSSFSATNSTSGNIGLNNTSSIPLEITGISQSGDGDVTITTDNDIVVSGEITKTGGSGTSILSINSGRSIDVQAPITSDSSKLNVNLNGHYSDPDAAGNVFIKANIETNGGDIDITGKGDADNSRAAGVLINHNVFLIADGGDITITGIGAGGMDENHGVFLKEATVKTTGSGKITLNGTSGNVGTGQSEHGVYLYKNDVNDDAGVFSDGLGQVNITGTGSGDNGSGVRIERAAVTSGKGVLTIHGIKGGSGTGIHDIDFVSSATVGLTEDLEFQEGNIVLNAGSAYTGTVYNNGTIGISAGNTSMVGGDYLQGTNGNLHVDLAGINTGQYGKLHVSGNLTLAGTLIADTVTGYIPTSGDYFSVITMGGGSSSTGTFATLTAPPGFTAGYNLASGEAVRLMYAEPAAKVFTNSSGGMTWETPGNWSFNALPLSTDKVLISSGHDVIHGSGTDTIAALTINSGNSLDINGGSLEVIGLTTLGGTFKVSGTGAATLNGDLQGGTSGAVELSGGTLNIAGDASVADYQQSGGQLNASNFTVTNAYTRSGGTALTSGNLSITQANGNLNTGVWTVGGNVAFTAAGTGADVILDGAISKTSGDDAAMNIKAARAVMVNAPITSTAGKLDVTLNAHYKYDADLGSVSITDNISTKGGNLVVGGGGDPLLMPAKGYESSNPYGVNLDKTGTLTINTEGGDISIRGQGYGGGVTDATGINIGSAKLYAAGGNILLWGKAGDLTTSNLSSGLYLTDVINTTGAGNITLEGFGGENTTGSNRGIYIIGSGTTISSENGNINISGTGGVNADTGSAGVHISGAKIQSTASGDITLTGIAGGSNSKGFVTSGATNNITSSGMVTIQADKVALGATTETIGKTGSTVTIQPLTAGRPIVLGTDSSDANNDLELSSSELGRITANQLHIGSSQSGAISVGAAIAPANVNSLYLQSGAGITQTVGGGITVNNLAVQALGDVDLAQSSNMVTNLAAVIGDAINTGKNFSFKNSSSLNIGTVGSLSGVQNSYGNDVTITNSAGNLVLNAAVVANTAVGKVTLHSEAGTISDALATGAAVTGYDLALLASTGIGTGFGGIGAGKQPIKTKVARLVAQNNGVSGDINIVNSGALTTYGWVSNGNPTNTTGGRISIVANSPLTISNMDWSGNQGSLYGGVSAQNDIWLEAGASGTGATGDILTLNGKVSSAAGDITLQAGNAIVENSTVTAGSGKSIIRKANLNPSNPTPPPEPPPPPPPPPPPTMDACIADPSQSGCSAVLPSVDTCTANPTAPGCSAVLPSLDTCTTNPTAPGCSAVLPSMDTCTANPTAPGCSAVLPSLDTCTTNPTAPGCSAVLPSMDTCITNPTAPGCSAVLPPVPDPGPTPPDPGPTPPDPGPTPPDPGPTPPDPGPTPPDPGPTPPDPGPKPKPKEEVAQDTAKGTANELVKDTGQINTTPTAPAGLQLVALSSGEADTAGGGAASGSSSSEGSGRSDSKGSPSAAGDGGAEQGTGDQQENGQDKEKEKDKDKDDNKDQQPAKEETQDAKPKKNYCN